MQKSNIYDIIVTVKKINPIKLIISTNNIFLLSFYYSIIPKTIHNTLIN